MQAYLKKYLSHGTVETTFKDYIGTHPSIPASPDHMPMHAHMSVRASTHRGMRMFAHMSSHLDTYMSVRTYTHKFVHMSIHMSAHVCRHMFAHRHDSVCGHRLIHDVFVDSLGGLCV